MDIRIKRAYEDAARSDGPRILVDRIWPRGVAKEDAELEAWLKGLAPSTDLRKWFGHDPEKWEEFRQRYLKEDRKSTRLNSSHVRISYAVFCLKKKRETTTQCDTTAQQ